MRRGAPAILGLFLAGAACRGTPLETLRAEAYADLANGRLDGALRRADEGLARARAPGDRRWRWIFQVIRAEARVQQRDHPKEAAASLDEGLRSEPRDQVFLRALMTRAYALCVEAAANGGGAEVLDEASRQLDDADRLAATLGAEDVPAEIALRRGNCRIGAGRYAEAESPFREAMALARRRQLAFVESQSAGSMGMLRANEGRWDDATDWLERALASVPAGAPPGLRIKHLGNLGWCYLELGDHQRALPLLAEADALAARTNYRGDRLTALTHLAETRQGMGDSAGAREVLGRALDLARGQSNAITTAELLRHLALVALDDGQHEAAHAHVREALRLDTETRHERGRRGDLLVQGRIHAAEAGFAQAEEAYTTVLAQAGEKPEDQWEPRALLAQLYLRGGQVRASEAEFGRAFALMEKARAGLQKDESRISFFAGLRRFHEGYVDLLVQQGRIEEALVAAEQSRARMLQERLEGGRADAPRGRLDPRARARAAQAVILSFWVTPERTLLWVVTPRRVRLAVLAGEKALAARVDAYQEAVLNGRDPLDEHLPAGEWLYDTLLEPATAALPAAARVVVIPDGPLYRLNLETLVVPGPERHYWIEDVTLLTAPWAGAVAPVPAHRPRGERDLLLIGDPLPSNPAFPRLANAGREMAAIAALFEPARVTSYTRLEAQPGAYRDAHPERFTFLHFAAHATASEESPLDSAIVLSPRDDRYKLYAREVMAQPLRAEMVSLSACRGAGSRAYAGEGLVGLAWAFLAAGARNVLAGLWDVEDASTAETMEEVYRQLRAGRTPEEALRAAKLRLLRSGTVYRKPVYWGPFALYAGARVIDHGR